METTALLNRVRAHGCGQGKDVPTSDEPTRPLCASPSPSASALLGRSTSPHRRLVSTQRADVPYKGLAIGLIPSLAKRSDQETRVRASENAASSRVPPRLHPLGRSE